MLSVGPKQAANALLLKVNQIGSITEAITAYLDSVSTGWGVMVSHRSGETEDTFIVGAPFPLAPAFLLRPIWRLASARARSSHLTPERKALCRPLRTGAPCRSERVAKRPR